MAVEGFPVEEGSSVMAAKAPLDAGQAGELGRQQTLLKLLEELSGVSHNTIWPIESGRQGAHPCTIRKLAKALGVEPEELLK